MRVCGEKRYATAIHKRNNPREAGVDRETDNKRMAWAMGDLIENRPALSRWHPDYAEAFDKFMGDSG